MISLKKKKKKSLKKVKWYYLAAPPDQVNPPLINLMEALVLLPSLYNRRYSDAGGGNHHRPSLHRPNLCPPIHARLVSWSSPPGNTEQYWKRLDAAQAIALLVWEGLGLGGGAAVGDWSRNNGQSKILLGIGGGHHAPWHMDIVLKGHVWVGHLLSGYSLPMEDLRQSKQTNVEGVGGTWREAIKVATKADFPGGEVVAHLDHKSFKSWQRNAITGFLVE
ncbi:D-aminoacyl-tRNA deacylase [Camellia lanceoleosa]|uniref:D-aminoacyl-tRNA deacylase n=1 Tax=Camellia lanceoleosa TaxID=1840588 RepID=A0ACC0FDZ1_9ERIC|nr:D-aminoacyl-tRNA deacylase [Camellia lanceoleosa]